MGINRDKDFQNDLFYERVIRLTATRILFQKVHLDGESQPDWKFDQEPTINIYSLIVSYDSNVFETLSMNNCLL